MDFRWSDIQQLDRMLNESSTTEHKDTSQNTEHIENVNGEQHHQATGVINGSDEKKDNAANTAEEESGHNSITTDAIANNKQAPITTSMTGTNSEEAATMTMDKTSSANMHTPIPTGNSNNDYMLFLNLTTPTSSTIMEESQQSQELSAEDRKHLGEQNQHQQQHQQQHHHHQQHADSSGRDHHHNSISHPDFSSFHFDSIMDTEQLELIMQPPHPPNLPSTSSSSQLAHISTSRVNSVEFTPLLSPMMNPTLERVNSNKGKTGFSPLSSPILEFQKYNNASSLRQKRKDPHDDGIKNRHSSLNDTDMKNDGMMDDIQNESNMRSTKRSKTPVTTPLLSTMDSKRSSISKSNSISKGGASASPSQNHTAPFQTFVFKTQQFQPSGSTSSSKESSISNTNSSAKSIRSNADTDFTGTSFLDAFEGELTLPPPPNNNNYMDHDMGSMPDHNFIIPSSLLSGSHKQDSSASSVTPSTLMSMNSTPHLAHKRSSVLLNPNHHKSAQSSPVILPSSSMPADSMKFDFKTLNHAENYNNIIHQGAFAQYNNSNTNISTTANTASNPPSNPSSVSTPVFRNTSPSTSNPVSIQKKHMPAVGTSILSGSGDLTFKHSNKSTPHMSRSNSTANTKINNTPTSNTTTSTGAATATAPTHTPTTNASANANVKSHESFNMHSFNVNATTLKNETSHSNTNNNTNFDDNYNDNTTTGGHHHSDKKMSHKLAEQGRRNRMNIAIQELDKLIPESMKVNITVPSKATTVEMGCTYITELLGKIDALSAALQSVSASANGNGNVDGNCDANSGMESASPQDHGNALSVDIKQEV